MPAYNFQPRFVDLVRRGIKRQTIRADRRDGRRPRVGQRMFAYSGLRTKQAKLLRIGDITAVLPIEISPAGIALEGKRLDDAEANALALLDGFQHVNEMVGWFIEHHGRRFAGLVIRWT
jgi:hypothetical protein